MPFAEDFKEVERRALVENTAQDVFNILKDLESQASLHASRWIWELLQNARDAAPLPSRLCVRASFTPKEITFQHNGVAFSPDQVAHLIHHGSTKVHEEELIGRFGTGFLSSHIISKTPQISGCLKDGRRFAFVLDRTGTTPKALTASMERSSQDFVHSVSSEPTAALDHSTRFVYPVTPAVEVIAQQGVKSLEAYAPYVLAFNEEIGSIEIVQGNDQRIYERQPTTLLGENVKLTLVEIHSVSGECLASYRVASVAKEAVVVAILAKDVGGSPRIEFGPTVPKLFMGFPLFGTEGISLPGVLNSRQFFPKKDRDGLYLGQEQTDYNLANKALVEEACPLFLTLLRQCASSHWKGIERLCDVAKSESIRGIDETWLQPLIQNSIVRPMREASLLPTCGNQLIAPCRGQVPLGSPTVPSDELWRLLHDLSDSDETLVEEQTAASWERNVRGWATVIGVSPESMQEGITLDKCARTLARFASLDRLQEGLRSGLDAVDWCNRLFSSLLRAGQAKSFDDLALLPDQAGHFRKRKELFLDGGIDEALKKIGNLLELPIRSRLLHKDIASSPMSTLLQERKQGEVLSEISSHLRAQAQSGKPVIGFRDGNIQLFAWILRNAAIENLESFPVLTQETHDGEAIGTLSLSKNLDADTIPLSPPELWPEGAREFSDLFPSRYVLSSSYYSECSEKKLWDIAAKGRYVRLSPIYDEEDDVQDFVPDDTLTDDASHKSNCPVVTTQIAFLREKNVGLMDSARKSKSKCLALFRFLAGYLIRSDDSWSEHPAVDCECGKSHKCWKAGWLIPLRKIKWVYLDKNRSDLISVDSLAKLLKGEREVVNLLSEEQRPAFLAELGMSAGDFLMRVVASDEQSRMALSKSFIQIFQATGEDVQQVTDLALEIATYPDTIRELQERAATRRKIKRNQDVGTAVEKAIEAALGTDRGLKVRRAPVGSDYSVEPDNDFLDEVGQEVLLEVSTPQVSFLIEIKATVGNFVRMTETQGRKARTFPESYALCVVVLSGPEDEISATTIRGKSMFVFDIGTRVKPLVEALESIEVSRSGALTVRNDIELEMHDQIVKFKVGHEVWEAGIGFDDAVRLFGGTDATDTVPIRTNNP